MSTIFNEVRVRGPLESVFELATTPRYWPRWHPATQAVSGAVDKPLELGDRVTERAEIGGRVHEGTWTVVAHTRPVGLTLQIDEGRIEISYRFTPLGKDTVLRRELMFRPQDFAGGASDPAGVEARMHAQSEQALWRLASLVEELLARRHRIQLARGVLEEAFNGKNVDVLLEGFTADAAIHDPGMDFRGPAQLRHGLQVLLNAFPDFRFSVLDELADDERVVLRYRGQGTHRGEFMGIPATGRRIDYTGILLLRFEGERIAEFWANPDQLGVFKQLGG